VTTPVGESLGHLLGEKTQAQEEKEQVEKKEEEAKAKGEE
jgi:hypothetical protein